MPSLLEPGRVAQIMASWIGLQLISCRELQTLWAGYGHVCAVTARSTEDEVTVDLILKLISPPRGQSNDEGHLRKMLSYEVEQHFYNEVAPHLEDDVAVAKCLASTQNMKDKPNADELKGVMALILQDLRPKFPIAGEKRAVLSPRQVQATLDWLAKFHSSSWQWLPQPHDQFLLPPLEEAKKRKATQSGGGSKLWLNGGYTYLATRRTEYSSLLRDKGSEWSAAFCKPIKGSTSSIAELVADFLTPCGRPFETYIHGDVKSENLFTTKAGDRVAFFDFQYAGLGLGVCDLAKLFTCSVPMEMLTDDDDFPEVLKMEEGERNLLDQYYKILLSRRPSGDEEFQYEWNTFVRHWETALVDWCRFQASWGFWGNTDWLEARVRSILQDSEWNVWLQSEVANLSR